MVARRMGRRRRGFIVAPIIGVRGALNAPVPTVNSAVVALRGIAGGAGDIPIWGVWTLVGVVAIVVLLENVKPGARRVSWSSNEKSSSTVGWAGPGPSCIAAGGDRRRYTNRTALHMAHNLVSMAGVLAGDPCPTNLRELDARALPLSDD